jgi:hypothetical protein
MARQSAPGIFARFARSQGGRSDSGVLPDGFEQVGSGAGENGGGNGRDTGDVDAGTIDLAAQSQKRPGRPRGRSRKDANADANARAESERLSSAEKASVDPPEFAGTIVQDISNSLAYIHQQLAMGMQCPEMALSKQESDTLAKQVANVGKYYVKIDGGGKVWAHFALLFTLLILYVPRWMILKRRQQMMMQPPPIRDNNQTPPDFIMPAGVMPS